MQGLDAKTSDYNVHDPWPLFLILCLLSYHEAVTCEILLPALSDLLFLICKGQKKVNKFISPGNKPRAGHLGGNRQGVVTRVSIKGIISNYWTHYNFS